MNLYLVAWTNESAYIVAPSVSEALGLSLSKGYGEPSSFKLIDKHVLVSR